MELVTVYYFLPLVYCPSVVESSVYGDYDWTTAMAGVTLERPCVHDCVPGMANKTCNGTGEWALTNFTNCKTAEGCIFLILSSVSHQ